MLTVGASSTNGTLTRYDDTMAELQLVGADLHRLRLEAGSGRAGHRARSRWPRRAARSTPTKAAYLLAGKLALGSKPYLALSGTSMAAPVVTGHGRADAAGEPEPDAEPDQGDPAVHRRSRIPGYSPLRQGAGFLNTLGAVRLAKFYMHRASRRPPADAVGVEPPDSSGATTA